MLSYQDNLRLKCVSPLQFVLSVPKNEVYSTIFKLREKALKIFPKVSKIFRLFNEACLPMKEEDPLFDAKLLGHGLLIKDNRIITVIPESIIGFAFLLPTNKVAYMALAIYPESIEKDGITFEIPYSGEALWSGMAETFVNKCQNCDESCSLCLESHELVCELLQKAEDLGALSDVQDQTDYWTTKNVESLKKASSKFRCGCLSENLNKED